jgi:cyclophilin family peptidyl-prolyl cis-trans isomerase
LLLNWLYPLTGKTAYVTDGTAIHVIDISDPTSLAKTKTYENFGDVQGLQISSYENLAFIADGIHGLKVFPLNGVTTNSFSTVSDVVSVSVQDNLSNTAPVLNSSATPQFNPMLENAGVPIGPVGTLVSDLIDTGGHHNNFSDVDGDLPGIAIVETNLQGGSLWYSTNNGVTWEEIDDASEQSPQLLRADSETRLYFQPASDFSGSITDIITIRAWDRTGGWQQLGQTVAGESAQERYGSLVRLSGDGKTYIATSRPQESVPSVSVFTLEGSTFVPLGNPIFGNDYLGNLGGAISISHDGRTIAIGTNGAANNTGRVLVYRWIGDQWTQIGNDLTGEAERDEFGHEVSISDDGNTVAISAKGSNGSTGTGYDWGRVQVYTWNGTSWVQLGENIDGMSSQGYFGSVISLSGDGSVVAVRSKTAGASSSYQAHHLRMFRWSGSEWLQLGQQIDGYDGDRIGMYSGLSISENGMTLAVNVLGNSYNELNSTIPGSVRVYSFNSETETWQQRGTDVVGREAREQFGHSVVISADGNRFLASAPFGNNNTGRAAVYEWNENTLEWSEVGSGITGLTSGDSIGRDTVGMDDSGTTIVLGSRLHSPDSINSEAGIVQAYQYIQSYPNVSESTDTVSVIVTPLTPDNTPIPLNWNAPQANSLSGSVSVADLIKHHDNSVSFAGMAVTGFDSSLGTLFYTTDGGAAWQPVTNATTDAALLLAQDATTHLYMQLDSNLNDELTPETIRDDVLTYKPWIDQNSFSNGQSEVNTGLLTSDNMVTLGSFGDYSVRMSREIAISSSGEFAIVAGQNYSFKIVDIADPANLSVVQTISRSTKAYDVTISPDDSLAFLLDGDVHNIYNPSHLRIFDISDLQNPVELGAISFDKSSYEVVIHPDGQTAYVVMQDGVKVIDFSNPSSPVEIGTVSLNNTSSTTSSIVMHPSHETFYVAEWDELFCYSLENPQTPVLRKTLSVRAGIGRSLAMSSDGTRLLWTGEDSPAPYEARLIDTSSPHDPTLLGVTRSLNNVSSDAVFFDTDAVALVTQGGDGTRVIDYSDENSLIIASTRIPQGVEGGHSAIALTPNGDIAIVAAGQGMRSVRIAAAGFIHHNTPVSGLVADSNQQPTDVTLSNQTVGENQQGATVGTFSTVDPDTDDTFTYSLVSGAGDENNNAFYIEGDVLKATTSFDYETTNTANIRVRSTDSGGLSLEKTFTISVSNFNEPPTDIALSTTTINENAGAGARVGQLTTSDPDDSSFGTTFTYALVAGSGDTDNGLFEISGDQLLARSSFDYEVDSSYSIRLRTTDLPGFSYEEVFTIDVGDVNEAPTSVSLTNLVTTLQSDTNTEVPTLVADIVIEDDALGTNQISLTGDDAGLFTVIDSAVYLIAGATLDPENSPLSFTVVVSDPSLTTGSGNTVVRFSTNAPLANPDFLVELTSNTPLTNANFLSYVNNGAYDHSIFHRSVPDFVIQGGGISAPTVAADQPGSDPVAISTTGTVLNEPGNLNVRGTIAMAKLGGQPDSATNQFFFNLNTNSFLDTDNGGYTVFGNVLNDGMTVIDTMASALTYDATTYYSNTALSDLPLWKVNQDNIIRPEDFVKINSVSVVPSGSSVSDSHTIEITAAPTPGPETEFLYSFNHVNEAGADDYLVSSTNMRRYSEWQSPPLTYWGPSSNDQEGQLVYKFPLSGLTTSASLYASSPTWDFFTEPGGYGRGASALEVSNDGETWVSLHNNLEPRNWGGDWTFDDALPAEALGTTELWVRMRFYVENAPNSSYTVAQFGRSTSAATTPAFGLNVTMTTEAPPNTPPTGEVIIFGTAAEDQILTAKNSLVDADGIGPISYQWSRNSVPVSGATDEHYTLMQADVGSQITLTATYTDDRGTVESVDSAPTAVVQNINDAPTGTLTITGVAIEDSVLSADTSDIADEDGLGPFSYQWIRNGDPITGATASTYQLTQDDVQANLAVTVNYVDGYGHNESLHAVVNDPIANLNDRPVLYTAPSPTFNSVPENAGSPAGPVGTPVTSLIDSSGPLNNFFDEDGDLPGIAVTATNLQGGTLWQSQDGGTTWNPVGIVSETAPLLLEADADNRLYFQPSENFFGTISDVISFKAWDRTGTGAWQQLGGDFDGEAAGNRAGRSVSVSADGNTIVIGEHGSDALWTNSGKVHAYRWTGNDWQQLGESILGDGSAGWSVSMSDDGNRIAVGSPWAASTGHATVYSWTGEEWLQTGQSLAGINNLDRQGWSVALSGDGNSLAVGANNDDSSGEDAGKTTIYQLQNDEWVQVGSPILGEAAGDESGSSVTISQNGEIVAVGARYNDGNGTHAGHAQVFEWNGSEWQQLGDDLDGAAELFRHGDAISLSSDGYTLAVGAPKDDTAGAGAGRTFVYDWNGVTWELRGAPIDGEMPWSSSGLTVSLSNDGDRVAVGAPYNDGAGTNAGHARVYQWTGSTWSQVAGDMDGEVTEDKFGQGIATLWRWKDSHRWCVVERRPWPTRC